MKPVYSEQLRRYIDDVSGHAAGITTQRKDLISEIVRQIQKRAEIISVPQDLVFICTHNSRRSHFAQVWCKVALSHYQIANIECWSGGTEVTACNERTVAALRRSGLEVSSSDDDDNPVYEVRHRPGQPPIQCFSKIYNQSPNPRDGFIALLCCSDVDERCPVIVGAAARFSLHYDDPKVSDGTANELQIYDQRCLQIATEMFYLAKRLAP